MTPSRPRDYLIKYPNLCLLNEQDNGLGYTYLHPLVNQDLRDNDIKLTENEIRDTSKLYCKKYVNIKVKETALKLLVSENLEKSKTKHIEFQSLEMSQYLSQNRNTFLSKPIFSVRSGTLDIKV